MAYIDKVQIENKIYDLRDSKNHELLSHVVGVVENLYAYGLRSSGTILTTSGTSGNAEWDTSNQIPVEPGKTYKFQWWKVDTSTQSAKWDDGETKYLFYKQDGSAILEQDQTNPYSRLCDGAEAPANAAYLRVSVHWKIKPSGGTDLVEIDASKLGVVARADLFPETYLAYNAPKIYRYAVDDAIDSKADKADLDRNVNRVLELNLQNLYDPDQRQIGARFTRNNNNVITISATTSNDISGYIPVVPGSKYIGKVLKLDLDPAQWATGPYQKGELYVLYSDKNENAYVRSGPANELINGVTIPDGVAYMRVSIRKDSIANAPVWAVIAKQEDFPTEIPSEYPKPYKFVDDLALNSEVGELDERVAAIEEDIPTKANKAGSEPQLIAGSADQLVSQGGTENNLPYLFRENASGSDRVTISQITGGTVVWNQLMPDTASLDTTSNGVHVEIAGTAWKITGTGSADAWISSQQVIPNIIANHVYAVILSSPIPNGSASGMRFGFTGTGVAGIYESKIIKATGSKDSSTRLQIRTANGSIWEMDSRVCVYDLTQMFGATVAAEFQRIETATPGAGVSLFRQMFPESYYPYNAGELLSVQTSGRKTVGFNQWDEEWELGTINTSGANQNSTSAIRTKNYIRVIPGQQYYVACGITMNFLTRWYDGAKQFIGTTPQAAGNNTVTAPSGACYLRLGFQAAYGTTYKHDVCVNLSDPSRNGTYESYSAHTYPLDSTMTLRGIPVLSDGVPAYDGDQYFPDGTVTRRYGIVDLGTLYWSIYQSTAGAFRAAISDYSISSMGDAPDFICGSAKYTPINTTNSDGIFAAEDKIILHQYNIGAIVIKDSEYGSDTSALAASLSGVYLVYELATPTTETAAPYQDVQIAGSTEEFLPPATDTRAAAVPVVSESLYQTNLREGLETLLDTDLAHAESVAPVQGSTASTNITAGELLMRDGHLYKATQSIVAGGEITPDTNVAQTDVATQLANLDTQLTTIGTQVTEADDRLTEIEGYGRSAGYIKAITTNVYNRNGAVTAGGISYTQDGEWTMMTMEDGTSSSAAIYIIPSWKIDEWKGKGYLLYIDVTNANPGGGSKWKLSRVMLSASASSWTTSITLSLTSLGLDANAAHTSCVIDIDNDWADYDLTTYKRLLIAPYVSGTNTDLVGNTVGIRVRLKRKVEDYVYADELTGFDQSDYYTKEEISELLPTAHDYKIVFWGDSLTAGAGGGGTNYPAVCASELGIASADIKNCGVGGESANTIAARQGGNTLIIPAGTVNGQYPYTDFVDVFGGSVRPLRQGNGGQTGNIIYIDGQECTLSITQTSSTSTDAVYTIAGYTGSSSAIPKLARFAGSDVNAEIVVIWVGQNGSKVGSDTSITARMAIIDSMISHIGHQQYVVLGKSSGTNASQDEEDATMMAHYGNKFMPVRKLLVSYGLTIAGLTPTEQDNTDIAAGTVPTSLRNDGVHMNNYGYTAIGKLLAEKIRALGYV